MAALTQTLDVIVNVKAIQPIFPRIMDYFGIWAMEEGRFFSCYNRIKELDLLAHVRSAIPMGPGDENDDDEDDNKLQVTDDGVAVIDICGSMMKHVSSLMEGCSTVRVRQQLRMARTDPTVRAVALRIESPGGTVAGTGELAADIVALGSEKPCYAYIEDLGASAAYWVASQASKVYANSTALVGSIGTYAVIVDQSAAAEAAGVKVHVVKAGEMKGMGTPGTVVTDEQLSEMQRVVSGLNEQFVSAVSKGRRIPMKRMAGIADGRVHLAQAAQELGLLDGIESFDAFLTRLGKVVARAGAKAEENIQVSLTPADQIPAAEETVSTEEAQMPDTVDKAKDASAAAGAAMYAELKRALVGADAEFICRMQEEGKTLADAQAAWMVEQNERLKAVEAKTKLGTTSGVTPLKTAAAETEYADPIALWENKIQEKMTRLNCNRAKAAMQVNRENPGLRQQYVDAYNVLHMEAKRR